MNKIHKTRLMKKVITILTDTLSYAKHSVAIEESS